MQARVLETSRGNVHYWTSGKGGELIAFIHGATIDHGLFNYQVEELRDKYRTIVLDVPSHGLSRPYTEFTLQHAAEDLNEILEQERVPRAHLVGQSMGGYIAQIFALKWSEKVLSITSVGSSPIQPSYYSRLDNFLLKITPTLLGFYPYNYLIKTIANQIALSDSGKDYAHSVLTTYSKKEISKIMEAVYKGIADYQQDFQLDIPILITYGEHDKAGKVQQYSKEWAKNENRELIVIPNAAHNANMDNPREFNEILHKYIQGLRRS